MPARTIVLHIGPHKTGSTAIQGFCDQNRVALASRGVLYPTGRWHGQLASCFVEHPIGFVYNVHGGRIDPERIVQEDAAYLENLTAEIRESSCETVLLSYEAFFAMPIDALERLHAWMRSVSERQQVIFYCRPPISFALSELSQRYRMGLPSGFGGVGSLPILEYEQRIPGFVEVFGRENVMARYFTRKKLAGGDVVDDIFAAIGYPHIGRRLAPTYDTTENRSISAEAALLAAAIARHSPPPMPGSIFTRRYDRILSEIRGAKISLTDDERQRVLAAAEPHCAYLQREFNIAFTPSVPSVPTERRLFEAEFVESIAVQLHELVTGNEREQDRLQARIESLENELSAVYGSRSWKVTAPLRRLRRLVAALRGRWHALAASISPRGHLSSSHEATGS